MQRLGKITFLILLSKLVSLFHENNFTNSNFLIFWLFLGVTAATHPFDLAKTLIQIGHEPLAPKPTRSIFGTPQLSLPSVFVYIGHIKKKDGFFGMYRGLVPKLVTLGASAVVSDQFAQNWPKSKCE